MAQPVPKQINVKPTKKKKKTVKSKSKTRRHKQDYGISKLEKRFAETYLDKLGVKYIYEYEAKDIKRFYDFAIVATMDDNPIYEMKHGVKSVDDKVQYTRIQALIEIDGGFYHADPRVVNEDKLNPMQKHNKFVDSLKDKWCELHHLPLLRIWEKDINEDSKKVFQMLEDLLKKINVKNKILETKKRPH